MRSYIISVLTLCTVSCIPKEKHDVVTLSNDAKWKMYCLNYSFKAAKLPNYEVLLSSSIECEVELNRVDTLNGDTIKQFYSFVQSGDKYRLIETPDSLIQTMTITPAIGLGFVKGSIAFPCFGNIVYDFVSYPDSINHFFTSKEKGLISYLENYPEPQKIATWLQGEMKRRGIRNKHSDK